MFIGTCCLLLLVVNFFAHPGFFVNASEGRDSSGFSFWRRNRGAAAAIPPTHRSEQDPGLLASFSHHRRDPNLHTKAKLPVSNRVLFWFMADDLHLPHLSAVAKWPDMVSNDGATPFVDVNAPTFIEDGLNGLPVVRFNGQGQRLEYRSPPIEGLSGLTVFIVSASLGKGCADWLQLKVDPENGDVGPVLFWTESGTWGGVGFSAYDDIIRSRFGLGEVFGTKHNVNTFFRPIHLGHAFSLSTFVKDGESELIYVEGRLVYESWSRRSYYVRNTGNHVSIGGGGVPGYSCFHGDIAEIIAYNVSLTPKDRKIVEDYLSNKWFNGSCMPAGQLAHIC